MTIRESLTLAFGTPIQNMSFPAYFAYLNTGGKITQRSLMDILTVLCEQLDERQKTEELYNQNFKDIEVILVKLVKKEQPTNDIASSPTPPEVYQFTCATCNKPLKTKLALAGHSRSHTPKPVVLK